MPGSGRCDPWRPRKGARTGINPSSSGTSPNSSPTPEQRLERERAFLAELEHLRSRGDLRAALVPGKTGGFRLVCRAGYAPASSRTSLSLGWTPSLPELLRAEMYWDAKLSSRTKSAWKVKTGFFRTSLGSALIRSGTLTPEEAVDRFPLEVVLGVPDPWYGVPEAMGSTMEPVALAALGRNLAGRLAGLDPGGALPGSGGKPAEIILEAFCWLSRSASRTEWLYGILMDWIRARPQAVERALRETETALSGRFQSAGSPFWTAVAVFVLDLGAEWQDAGPRRKAEAREFLRAVLAGPGLEALNAALDRALAGPQEDLADIPEVFEDLLGDDPRSVRARIRAARALESGGPEGPEPVL